MSGLLDRDLSVAQTREIRELGRPVLQSVVDTAVGVFERSSQTAGDGDANLGILMPFHWEAIEALRTEMRVELIQELIPLGLAEVGWVEQPPPPVVLKGRQACGRLPEAG